MASWGIQAAYPALIVHQDASHILYSDHRKSLLHSTLANKRSLPKLKVEILRIVNTESLDATVSIRSLDKLQIKIKPVLPESETIMGVKHRQAKSPRDTRK